MADWKQELRDALKGAGIFGLKGDSWTFIISDERMKELEKMGLWNMEETR